MTLGNPAGLFLLLSLPVIVLLHLFRQERRRREVSSLFLWREIADQQSRRMRPQLLRNLNLLLQLLAATAASFALAQPQLAGSQTPGAPRMIVLVDTSASMRANEGSVTRLDLARNRAREVIGRTRRDTEVMVATAGPLSAVRQGFTTDRNLLYDVIREIEPQDGPGDLASSVEMIRGLGEGRNTDVVFVTDGAFDAPESLVLPDQFRIERVGTPLANLAIAEFQLRRRLSGGSLEAYLEVANFGPAPELPLVEVTVDGNTVLRREIQVPPGEIRRVAVPLPGVTGSVFEVSLAQNEDPQPLDDRAYAVSRSSRPVRVQLVTNGNYFLESILSVYPDVVLFVSNQFDESLPADLYVFDGVETPVGLKGSVLAIGTAIPGGPFEAGEYQSVQREITLNTAHPIARNLDLSDVSISRMMGGTLSGRSLTVAAVGENPLIYAGTFESVRMVGINFALSESDIGLRSSFPVLMNNILRWLAPSPGEAGITAVPAGTPVDILVTPGSPVEIVSPSGITREYLIRENTLRFRDTLESGIYRVAGSGFTDLFAVTLASADEADLRPRYQVETTGEAQVIDRMDTGRPVWYWIAALAVLVLTADWIVWARRT